MHFILTKSMYQEIWNERMSPLTQQIIPDYEDYLMSERMLEDYLDIFRGKNTRLTTGNIKMPYPHPFFNGEKPKLEVKPCIKYIMIGESRPFPKAPKTNACGGDAANTFFYNIFHVGSTAWLREPYKALFPTNPWIIPRCPNDKIQLLLELASAGYLLLDLFPFALSFPKGLRKKLNTYGISDFFFNNRINVILQEIAALTCNKNDKCPLVSFSGPPLIHHYLAHQIASGALALNPNFNSFTVPNYFIPPIPMIPPFFPAIETPWVPQNALLNTVNTNYPNLYGARRPLQKVPYYRCCTYSNRGTYSPDALLIANSFNI